MSGAKLSANDFIMMIPSSTAADYNYFSGVSAIGELNCSLS